MADRESLDSLISRPETQSEDVTKFIKYLEELKNQVSQRLLTTVEDELTNRNTLHDLTERERKAEESKSALQKKLNEIREKKEHVIFGLDQSLRKLQSEKNDISQFNDIELESVEKDKKEAVNKALADHELRMRQLQDQIDGVEKQLVEVMEKNREEELRLRKEKNRAEAAMNAKISQYDEHMSVRQRSQEELNQNYASERAEYALLKAHFDKVDANVWRTQEEQAIIEAMTRREEFGYLVCHDAATSIQKIIRGKQARAVYLRLKAKAKKVKKGKKGKKGGKKK